MTFDRSDFARIQISLLAAIAMLVAGAGLVWLSTKQVDSAARAKAEVGSKLAEFERKLSQVRAEEREIKEKAAVFSNLRARGVIGEEQRLDWVELIKDVRDARKLLDVQYEFAPQQSLDKASVSGYAFKSSAMRLQMKLLHEGDLLNFINDLRAKAKAYVRVRGCNVTRIPRATNVEGDFALLNAECELEWITILPAKGAS
jgi:hypothetical protein